MKQRKPPESVRGAYSALPHAVLDSTAYTGASPVAKALLNELIRQHNGGNNGRLQLAHTWLAPRGWPSKSVVEKARAELIERNLIIATRPGGLFIGPTWYALTWLPISNHVGLETSPSTYHPGGWQCCDLPPTSRRKPPVKKSCQPVHRGSTDPYSGTVNEQLDPYSGAIEAFSTPSPDPYSGDDVLHHSLPAEIFAPEWCLGSWRWVGNQARTSHRAPGGRFSLYRGQRRTT